MDETVREAEQADLAGLAAIELSGDRMFREHGIVFGPGPATVDEAVAAGARVMVVGRPAVGFAALVELDGHPHLEQISVHAERGRRGLGTRLLAAVIAPGMTLLTFRDLPWNRPWYARHGFEPMPEAAWGPELRAHWDEEVAAGLHGLGPRLVMRYPAT